MRDSPGLQAAVRVRRSSVVCACALARETASNMMNRLLLKSSSSPIGWSLSVVATSCGRWNGDLKIVVQQHLY